MTEVPGCAARAMSPPDYPPPELLEQRKAALRAAKLVEAGAKLAVTGSEATSSRLDWKTNCFESSIYNYLV